MIDTVEFSQTKAAINDYRNVFLETAEDERTVCKTVAVSRQRRLKIHEPRDKLSANRTWAADSGDEDQSDMAITLS